MFPRGDMKTQQFVMMNGLKAAMLLLSKSIKLGDFQKIAYLSHDFI